MRTPLWHWEAYPYPTDQVLHMPFVMIDSNVLDMARKQWAAEQNAKRRLTLSAEMPVAVAEYVRKHPGANKSRIARDLAPRFELKVNTLRRML